jgi:hypothetical protein
MILAGCSTPTAQTNSVPPNRLDSILLTAQEANTLFGSATMELIGPVNHETFTKNLPTSVSDSNCLSTANVALDPVCQRALHAVSNVVIDVQACSSPLNDLGRQSADKLAVKATR